MARHVPTFRALALACTLLVPVAASAQVIQNLNLGAAANDSTGDTLRSGGYKINTNFANIVAALQALHPMTYRSAWAASTAYAANDVVTQGGVLYLAPSAFTSGSTFSAGPWTALTTVGGGGGIAIGTTSGTARDAALGIAAEQAAVTTLSLSGSTLTVTKGGGSTSTITLPSGSGASTPAIRVITASGAVTAAASDGTIKLKKTASEATAVTLEASPPAGTTHVITDGKGDAATNNITISPAGGQTINGASSLIISVNRGSYTLQFDGVSDWSII